MSRKAEIEKYKAAYTDPRYGISRSVRRPQAEAMMRDVAPFKSYLDVGCGRGEMLDYAERMGASEVIGTEVVPDLMQSGRTIYAEAHDLPFTDDRFQVVTCFDVLEHLLEPDVVPALKELSRVAWQAVALTVSNASSVHKGVELHPTRWPYHEWREKIEEIFCGWKVEQPPTAVSFNQPFLITRH